MSKINIQQKKKTLLLMLFIALLVLSGCAAEDVDSKRIDTAKQLKSEISSPGPGDCAGDMAFIAICKSGIDIDSEYKDNYYNKVLKLTEKKKGILSDTMYTHYARTSMALEVIGKDPKDIAGYNLLEKIDDYNKVSAQGTNGEIYALIASNFCDYRLENEERYIKDVIEDLTGEERAKDRYASDWYGMGLQGLTYYKDRPQVKTAIEDIVEKLKLIQEDSGGFGTCESTAQVILGLCAIGEDPHEFKSEKGGKSVVEGIMEYSAKEGFSHMIGDNRNPLATEQALMALDSVELYEQNKAMFPKK